MSSCWGYWVEFPGCQLQSSIHKDTVPCRRATVHYSKYTCHLISQQATDLLCISRRLCCRPSEKNKNQLRSNNRKGTQKCLKNLSCLCMTLFIAILYLIYCLHWVNFNVPNCLIKMRCCISWRCTIFYKYCSLILQAHDLQKLLLLLVLREQFCVATSVLYHFH